jgi:predicted metalloprotease with PDZ domain
MLRKTLPYALALFTLPLAVVALPATAQQPIRVTADLTQVGRKLYSSESDIPVKAGHLALTMPKWIPGTHGPTGAVGDLTGLVFTANGKTIPWRRDDVDMFEFHLDVPAGVTSLHAHIMMGAGRSSDQMAVLEWERLMIYPAHIPVAKIAIQPTVIVPAGWGIGTALTPTGAYDPNAKVGGATEFAATTVEQLEDSPVITGVYFHEFALAPDVTPKHFIDVVSDDPDDSNLRPAVLAEISNLVHETGEAYGSRHYNAYHFLLTLSDLAGGEGLEHGQSSDNGVGELGFADDRHQTANADLLSHEFTHSWNGKYRRPATLYQPDFATPMQGELLWVYEGMTQYMGNVLAARSGLETQATYREKLAASAASLDSKPGRDWRSTNDTAIASSISRRPGPAWASLKRGQDYYQEGELLWLDADTLIRKLTDDKKSLTDFQHIFLGKGGNTGPLIVPYDRAELVADLNQVVKYDWATFIHERIDNVNPRADVAGIEQGGYKLVYLDHPSNTERAMAGARGPMGANVWYSLGLRLGADNTVSDVRWGSAADKAKLSPGDKIIAVNGRVASSDMLRAAVKSAKGATEPIHFIVQNETYIRNVDVDYHDGERYPVLQRVEGTPDLLDEITKPLSPLTVLPKPERGGGDDSDSSDRPARQRRPAATN